MQYLMKMKWHDVMIALVVMVGAAMESGLLDGHAAATKAGLAVLIVGSTVGVKLAERWLPPGMIGGGEAPPTASATVVANVVSPQEAITGKQIRLPKLGSTEDTVP